MRWFCLLCVLVLATATSRKHSLGRLRNLRKQKILIDAELDNIPPHFSYICPSNPTHHEYCPTDWEHVRPSSGNTFDGGIPDNFCTLNTGSTDRQSPIPFPETVTTPGPYSSVAGSYHTELLHGHVINNGHTIKVKLDHSCSTLVLSLGSATQTATYHLKEFHFHAPSEHHLGGPAAFELHLVHKMPELDPPACLSPDMADAAVALGILFDVGAENIVLATILKGAMPAPPPHGTDDGSYPHQTFSPTDSIGLVTGLLDQITEGLITYPGSLTTPSCAPVVRWLVSKRKLTISEAQLAAFKATLPQGVNARPLLVHNPATQPITEVPVTAVTFTHGTGPCAGAAAPHVAESSVPPEASVPEVPPKEE
jgi:carbonic anhydrase